MPYPKGKPKSEESKAKAAEAVRRAYEEGRHAKLPPAPASTQEGRIAEAKGFGSRGGETRRQCVICGEWFPLTKQWHRKNKWTCKLACRGLLKHRNAVGRKVTTSEGYVRVMVPTGTPGADKSGRMLEHRWVMQQAIGRPLRDDETVHHRDGNKVNNVFENLQLTRKYHGNSVALRCRNCGSDNIESVELFDN